MSSETSPIIKKILCYDVQTKNIEILLSLLHGVNMLLPIISYVGSEWAILIVTSKVLFGLIIAFNAISLVPSIILILQRSKNLIKDNIQFYKKITIIGIVLSSICLCVIVLSELAVGLRFSFLEHPCRFLGTEDNDDRRRNLGININKNYFVNNKTIKKLRNLGFVMTKEESDLKCREGDEILGKVSNPQFFLCYFLHSLEEIFAILGILAWISEYKRISNNIEGKIQSKPKNDKIKSKQVIEVDQNDSVNQVNVHKKKEKKNEVQGNSSRQLK